MGVLINQNGRVLSDGNGHAYTGNGGGEARLQAKETNPATSVVNVTPDAGYDGLSRVTVNAVTSAIDSNIQAGNIRSGVSILGVAGTHAGQKEEETFNQTYTSNGTRTISPSSGKVFSRGSVTVNVTPNLQNKTVAPTTSQQTVVADSSYDGLRQVTVSAVTSNIDSNIRAANIKKGVRILGVTGSYEGGGGGGDDYSITPVTLTWQHNTYVTIGLNIAADGTLTVYKASGSGTANNLKVCYPQGDTFVQGNVITSIDFPQAEGTYEMPITVWWDNQSGENQDHNNHTISYTVTKGGSGGETKDLQVKLEYQQKASNNLASTGLSLTAKNTGTYTISWTAWRSSNSGTMSTRIYVNGSAQGTDHTSWTQTYGQQVTETNIALTAGQTVEVYARSGSTSRYVLVANLILQQTS